MSRYVTISTDVDVYLDEIDTDDLIEELESRSVSINHVGQPAGGNGDGLVDKIYQARRLGKPYEDLLDQFLYQVTGRAI